jgi:sensor histidine kinase regulating citrate/malate metabolism
MGLFANNTKEVPATQAVVVSTAVEQVAPTRFEAPAKPEAILDHNKDMAWHEVARAKRKMKSPLGIQGKLLLAFFALMSAALGVTCVIYSMKVHQHVSIQLKNQASTIANSLAQSTLTDFMTRDLRRVGEVGQRVVSTSDVMAVSFHDASGTVVTTNSRGNVQFDTSKLSFTTADLGIVEPCIDQRLGELYRVTVPVLGNNSRRGNGILGYVTVAVSRKSEAELSMFLGKAVIAVGAGMMVAASQHVQAGE